MKKVLMIVIPVALVAVFIAIYSSPSFGLPGRMMMGHRGGGMGKDFLFYRLDQLSKDLNLDQAQQAKMESFKQELSTLMDKRMEEGRSVHEEIRAELDKPNPDIKKVTSLIDQRIDAHAQMAHQMVQKVESFYNDLTPEQRKILVEHFKDHMRSGPRGDWRD